MNVTIVDDSAAMRQLIRQMVGSKFERIVECSSGDECLEQFPNAPTDWVFMDLQMEGMNGIQATKALKQAFPETNVVIVTRYNDPDLRAVALEAGACGYVLKHDLKELYKVLETTS